MNILNIFENVITINAVILFSTTVFKYIEYSKFNNYKSVFPSLGRSTTRYFFLIAITGFIIPYFILVREIKCLYSLIIYNPILSFGILIVFIILFKRESNLNKKIEDLINKLKKKKRVINPEETGDLLAILNISLNTNDWNTLNKLTKKINVYIIEELKGISKTHQNIISISELWVKFYLRLKNFYSFMFSV